MATPNPVPQTDDTPKGLTLDQFIETYGVEVLEDTDEGRTPKKAAPTHGSGTPEAADDSQGPVSPPDESSDDSDKSPLDAATLKALGLTPEDEPSSSDDTQQDGTQQQSVDLAALATTLGLDEADLSVESGTVTITTKVDGEQTRVPLAELRKGYQLQQHFTRQNEEFLRQKQEWETAQRAREQQVQEQLTFASKVLDAEEETLKQRYSRDWESLRQEDPAEYAAQVAEYNQKLSGIRERKQQLAGSLQRQQQQAQQEYMERVQKMQQDGVRALADALGWKTADDQQKGGTKIRSYLQQSVGLHPQEIDGILDARVLVISDKARRYDELMAKVSKIRPAPGSAPKVPQGTASKPEGGKQVQYQNAKKRLSVSGTVDDAATLFKQMGIV